MLIPVQVGCYGDSQVFCCINYLECVSMKDVILYTHIICNSAIISAPDMNMVYKGL